MKSFFKPRPNLFYVLTLLVAGGAPLLSGTALGLETVAEPRFQVDNTAINRDGRSETSYAPIVKKAAPSVVNIYSTRTLNMRQRHSFLDDPTFRQFFGGDDNNPFGRKLADLALFQGDERMATDLAGDILGEQLTVNGQRAAGRDAGGLGSLHDE